MLAVNQILQNRYRIIRQLGEGGMGAVYEAEDNQRFGKKVALKEILLNLTEKNSEHFRRAFEREAKILTQIDHEAVPKVIGYILDTDFQILVMELIKGEDLDEILEREKKPFSLKNVLGWTDQLLDALDYLHTLKQPIIHRDIKPQNLKLTSRGRVKLLDFGIAKDSEAELSTTKSAHKTMVGATRYYSPVEQIIRIPEFFETLNSMYPEKAKKISRQAADARSDIYALGATLYQLLTNKYPKPADLRALEVWAGRSDSLKPLQELNSEISPKIAEVLQKAMAIERDDRFASASEMQTALQEAVSHENRRKEAEARFNLLQEQEKIKREREELEEMRRNLAEERRQHQKNEAKTQPSVTQPSFENSPEITSPPYSEKPYVKTIKSIKPLVAPVVDAPPESDKKKTRWILLFGVLAMTALGIAAFGIFSSLNNSGNSNKNMPVINNTQIASPSVSPTPEVNISPTVLPTRSVTIDEKPKPTIAPTISKPLTTTPQKPTQKPAKMPDRSDDCIYNGKCRN